MSQVLQIIGMVRPYWRFLAQSLLVGLVILFLSLPGPYLTKLLIDEAFPRQDFGLLYFLLGLGALVSFSAGLLQALAGHFGQRLGAWMGMDFQSRLYGHLQRLDFRFHDQRQTGELLSRFGDMHTSVFSTLGMIDSVVSNTLQLLIFPAVLFWLDWRLALLSLAVLPFDTVLVGFTGRCYRHYAKRLAESSAQVSAKTFESVAHVRTIQALGLEERFAARIHGMLGQVADLQVRSSLVQSSAGFLTASTRVVGGLAYAWYGWARVLQGELSVGTFLAFSGYVGCLYGPLQNLIGLWPQLETTLVHARRFLEVYDRQPEIRDRPEQPELRRVRGDVSLRGVTFGYGGQQVLRHLDLEIPAGATVALVGRSGAGKSTLVKLIPRFYDPDEGCVCLDGKDVRQYRLSSLRRSVGVAMQGSAVFQGTILDNLTFGRDIPLAEVEEAARLACIHEYIASLPEGYNSAVGEQGTGLSEGQKQRLGLARVLLLDSPVLILDEPTAALDPETERQIQEGLWVARQERTTLIVAHRLATIVHADQIVVLEDGEVVEQGTHGELLAGGGEYAAMYEKTLVC
jgi:ABC-type multidrug transport system fused ATPase/permease subunit